MHVFYSKIKRPNNKVRNSSPVALETQRSGKLILLTVGGLVWEGRGGGVQQKEGESDRHKERKRDSEIGVSGEGVEQRQKT